ncbi:MAG: YggS family pyridoxal phosphate-dependent enzyme [Armatimonadota bacterium]|nr:YggS family pyridoxal phosphate-dependent enzyme [Armatimonadota bacterium]MDR7428348.1 YggS family pyridoxal phosphate-dependent enzyme [Armatimonadota bacterium]MDR7464911.1 YggS family pyridoxal phosphate-dependent enzyme [Armatimonadota bacterium]MDR7470323.1 YggS family pyridoxal phosphate-dependent enzyme [Armatimonadota bacterium]MDR7475281.1 YggS family pyridoxal phosphate-dependent enzyme [Armatimonadota bacterium]
MQQSHEDLAQRLAAVRQRMQAAAQRSGRRADSVRLVAVTKGVAAARIREAMALGVLDFGENRVQEALPKIAALGPGPRWHLVGHLQRNKVRRAVEAFALIHSLDSLPLAEAISRRAEAAGRWVEVLLQVNVAGEPRKHGFAPAEVPQAVRHIAGLPALILRGLMTIAPLEADPQRVRPVFRRLRELRDALRVQWPGLEELSMGMSDDFEVAIEEGATLVRVGRAIFRERPLPPST